MKTGTTELKARRYLRQLLRQAKRENSLEAVVVLGSAARSTQVKPLSDLDVLVIGETTVPNPPAGVQVSVLTKDTLGKRATQGDDFAQWALRYGLPLVGERLCRQIGAEVLPQAQWPDPAVSLRRARARLDDAETLWKMGDLDAAREEARYVISHIARAVLLASREFPLSRPELATQLRSVGDHELAAILEQLFTIDEPTPAVIETALVTAAKRLSQSDPRFAPSLQAAFDQSGGGSTSDPASLGRTLSRWLANNYRAKWGSHRVLDEFTFGRYSYLFDSTLDSRTDPNAPDTRILAAWGSSDPTYRFGDRRTLRRFPLPPVARFDRGHLIAMAAGAGDYVNLIPQNPDLNRGWSAAGKRWRALERSIARDAGAFVFVAVYYDDISDIPDAFDYVVVYTDGRREFQSFSNRS